MKLLPHLLFQGDCEAAFRFYESCLNGRLEVFRYGGSPAEKQVPPEWRDKLLHVSLTAGNVSFTGADAPPGQYQKPEGIILGLQVDSLPESDRLFASLSAGGRIIIPLGATFWSPRFGMFTDRFGIAWMINPTPN